MLFAQDRPGLDAWWYEVLPAAPAVGALPGTLLAGVVARRVPVGWVPGGRVVATGRVLAHGSAPFGLSWEGWWPPGPGPTAP